MKKNPGPKTSWQEAKTIFGRGRGQSLPECTTNSNPKDTADRQNKFFVEKISKLVRSISNSEGKKSLKCNIYDNQFTLEIDLKDHLESVHEVYLL